MPPVNTFTRAFNVIDCNYVRLALSGNELVAHSTAPLRKTLPNTLIKHDYFFFPQS